MVVITAQLYSTQSTLRFCTCSNLLTGYWRFASTFGSGLITSMRLDDRKDIQSIKSAWSILDLELTAHVLLTYPCPLNGNTKGHKANIGQQLSRLMSNISMLSNWLK